jgi:putative membrane protein
MKLVAIRVLVLMGPALLSFTPLEAQNQTDPVVPVPPSIPSMSQPNVPQRGSQPNLSPQDSGSSPDPMQAMRDRNFLRKATEGSLAEIQFGELAAQKSQNDEIKDLGKKMVDDQTRINSEIASVAEATGVKLPNKMSKDDKAEFERLDTLSGDAFDKEYLSYMVKNHHQDLHEFRIEVNSTTDQELKSTAHSAAVTIHAHMVAIDRLARERGIEIPGKQKSPSTLSQN